MLAILLTAVAIFSAPAQRAWVQEGGQNVMLPRVAHIDVRNQECPAYPGASCVYPGQTTVYLDPDSNDQYTLMHEVGHIYDQTTMPQWQRVAFTRIMKYKRAWNSTWNGGRVTLVGVEEIFADAYADCAFKAVLMGGYGWHPTLQQFNRVCHMLRKR